MTGGLPRRLPPRFARGHFVVLVSRVFHAGLSPDAFIRAYDPADASPEKIERASGWSKTRQPGWYVLRTIKTIKRVWIADRMMK